MLADLLHTGAMLAVTAALGTAALALVATGSIRAALPVLLDLLAVAGVLNLAHADSWPAIGSAALVIIIRKVTMIGLAKR